LLILSLLTGLSFLFPETGLFPSPEDLIQLPSKTPEWKIKAAVSQPDELISPADTGTPQIEGQLPETIYNKPGLPGSGPVLPGKDGSQFRVLYYGDSQVEGDRITFMLRKLLRMQGGGSGPGLFLPVMQVNYTKALDVRPGPGWKRYNYLSYRSGEIEHTRLGAMLAYCRYLPEGIISTDAVSATVRIRPSSYADSALAKWEHLRMFYTNPDGELLFTVSSQGKTIYKDIIRQTTDLQELSLEINGAGELFLEFFGQVSPSVYGISIESKDGIIVDNLPQRGSAGLEFSMVDRENFSEMLGLLSPDLTILHYGLNIVRNIRNDYSYYREGLESQVRLLNEIVPGAVVLIAGVTDMALAEGDSLRSYPNIPYILLAQKDAAEASGAIFWNTWEEMGGEGSIVRWHKLRPPLAQSDYVHLTYAGADTLSTILFRFLSDGINQNRPVVNDSLSLANAELQSQELTPAEVPETGQQKQREPFMFTTPGFWIFLLLVLAGYSLVWKKISLRNLYLLLVSLFFYFKSGGLFLSLLILVTLIDYTCGLLIFRTGSRGKKRLFLTFSIISNLGILAYFKYTGLIVETLNGILGTELRSYDFLAALSNSIAGTSFDISSIILPVGISFFTFQSLSYTIDIYRGRLDPVRKITDFGFYVSFFPQLVAGPIVRASEFIPQLSSVFQPGAREFSHALFMILKGLIKKVVISDFLALNFIDRVFDMPGFYSGFENLMAVYGYGLQIYCDFSGYTDIATGIALVLGFRLPVNFNSPYKAADISDFWKRWHISLSRWLRDYLYIPLGGNRKGSIRTGINLMITMLLGGLWHGAGIRFIIWGGLHGIGLIISKIWNYFFTRTPNKSIFLRFAGIVITFNFVSFAWIFFRANDLDSVQLMLRQIFLNFNPGNYAVVISAYSTVFIAMAAGYMIHFLPERVKEYYRGTFICIPLAAQAVLVLMTAVLLWQMRAVDVMPFIYFRF
jgi:D-alanyl-lipoteichoic acid acyltransferase DltB (MBOAT superfamily)